MASLRTASASRSPPRVHGVKSSLTARPFTEGNLRTIAAKAFSEARAGRAPTCAAWLMLHAHKTGGTTLRTLAREWADKNLTAENWHPMPHYFHPTAQCFSSGPW